MSDALRERVTRGGVAIAAAMFVSLVVAFYLMVEGYRVVIAEAASRELEARAEVAARYLSAPLKTLDFAEIRRFGEDCRRRGYELEIRSASGGTLFHTMKSHGGEGLDGWLAGGAKCGECAISVCRPVAEVMIPYERAKRLFIIAALIGASGMFIVFFALYRQRVRIRELAKVEKFRREFIADVSHEIKTPLTGILGAVEMMEEEAKGEGRGLLLGMVRREANRLSALVQQILDLARLEREGERINRVETDLTALVLDVARRYGVQHSVVRAASRTGREPTSGTVTGFVDPQLIEQALANLIENAQRHSGSTDIILSLASPAASGGSLRLAVEDHGIGIPPDHLSQIFERFHRVDPARAAESGGAGLGLSIVRRIARLHGGDVACENVLPHGARFVLTLPRGFAASP